MSKPSTQRINLPSRLAAAALVHGLRAAGAADPMDDETRREMLGRVRAGGVVELELDATTYIQRSTPNRNFVRFSADALPALAKSYAGAPFQRNHSDDIQDRGGTVTASELAMISEPAGQAFAFRQTIRLAKPWAVEGALDGTIDRFSIGWHTTGDIVCSICGEKMASFFGWVFPECDHYPGDEYDVGAGRMQTCEMVCTAAEATEVSAVSIPGVLGTEIEGIRAALKAARQEIRGLAAPKTKEKKVMPISKQLQTIAATLGISHLPDDEEQASAIVAQKAEELAQAKQKAEAIAAETLGAETDRLIEDAVRAGKFAPKFDADGKTRIDTPIEKSIRAAVAAGGLAAGKQIVDGLTATIPVARRAGTELARQTSAGAAPVTAPSAKPHGLSYSKRQTDILSAIGVSKDDVEKYWRPPAAREIDEDITEGRE